MTRPGVVSVVVARAPGVPPFPVTALDGLGVELELIDVDAEGASIVGALNRGVRRASGEYVAFLDATARPDAEWLSGARRVLHEPGVACVASRIAIESDASTSIRATGDDRADVLFARVAAMVVDREVFDVVGGFDDTLSDALAELDLGWRLWSRGHRVRFEPRSFVAMPAGLEAAHLAPGEAQRVVRKNTGPSTEGVAVRRRRDHELFGLFHPVSRHELGAGQTYEAIGAAIEQVGVPALSSPRRRILIATGDVLETKMAGPAIRAWHMALALASEHDVELVSTLRCNLEHDDIEVRHAEGDDFVAAVRRADIVIFQGNLMALYPELRTTDRIIVADIYDPFHLEVLEQTRDLPARERRATVDACVSVLNEQIARADFMLCASDKQRDFWLGQLAAVGRINPAVYDDSENLDRLLAVVPFGVGDEPPQPTRPMLKGVVPGIGTDDHVVLWGGGVYNWFDPLTLLRAIDKLRHGVPNVRLFFLGLKHPNPHVGEMRMAVDTRALSAELGLTDVHVFFNEDWVPYDERQNFLLESDAGVSTHLDHIETAFSFRTRILDYLWAGLPVVATAGDSLAELLEARGVGFAVPAGDVDALEAALYRVLAEPATTAACRAASAALGDELRWERVLEPLLEFCRDARRAPDLVDPSVGPDGRDDTPGATGRRIRRDLGIFYGYVRGGDVRGLIARATARLRVMLGKR
ncbi:MAG: glycosyltransferase [Acidimicrobiia bacterium]